MKTLPLLPVLMILSGCDNKSCPEHSTAGEDADGNTVCECDAGYALAGGICEAVGDSAAESDADTDADSDSDTDSDTDADSDTDTDLSLEGYFRIETSYGERQIYVDQGQAFSYLHKGDDDATTLLVYVSSNPAATCEGVGRFLANDLKYDPSDLFSSGYCNLLFRFRSLVGDPIVIEFLEPYVGLGCTLGEGDFVRSGELGYQWSTAVVDGIVRDGEVRALAEDAGSYSFFFDPDSLTLEYEYLDALDEFDSVVPYFDGEITAAPCADMKDAIILSGGSKK